MSRFKGPSNRKGSTSSLPEIYANNVGAAVVNDGNRAVWGSAVKWSSPSNYRFNTANTRINTNTSFSYSVSATAPFDGATVTYYAGNNFPSSISVSTGGTVSGNLSAVSTYGTSNTVQLQIFAKEGTYNTQLAGVFTIFVSPNNAVPIWQTSSSISKSIAYGDTIDMSYNFSATTGAGSISYSMPDPGNLPGGSSINPTTGVLSIPSQTYGTYSYSFTLSAVSSAAPDTPVLLSVSYYVTISGPPQGQAQYDGTYGQSGGQCGYYWTAPAGVCRVHVLAIGAGGGGCYAWANCGGHGGGLVWANDICVTPGESYYVLAGRGGCWNGSNGGNSCFPSLIACGGCCGCSGGCWSFDGSLGYSSYCGGFGMVAYPSTAGGGGGGAGYCFGSNYGTSNTPGYTGCWGGGGSGAAYHSSTYGSGGGGGTGACGMCCYGTNGTCGNAGYSHQTGSGGGGGSGGTCGNPGEPWSNGQGNGYGCGGTYGGGGGGGGTSHGGGWGGPGTVRILWGPNRCWPCYNTHNLTCC